MIAKDSTKSANKEFKFTKTELNKIELPTDNSVRFRYYDTETRGLCIRAASTGTKSFYYYRNVKAKGGCYQVKLGNYPDMSIEQARGKANELNAELAKGQKPWEEAEKAKNELTLRKLFDIYIERHAKKTKKTWEVMIKDFERVAKSIENKKLSEISHSQAERLHAMLGEERGHYSANRAVQLLKSVYNKGKAWKLFAGENPFTGVTLFDERPRERFLSDQEVGKLLKALDSSEIDSNLRDFIKLCLFTGARKSNICSMRWQDIDLTHNVWTIPETKNGTAQKISLGPNELKLLAARRDAIDEQSFNAKLFVFPGEGRTGHIVDFKKSWTTLRAKVGIADCTIHDLRRSLGAAMASANVNMAIIKSTLNHKDLKTTARVYALAHKNAELMAREAIQAVWMKSKKAAKDEAEKATKGITKGVVVKLKAGS